MVRISEFTPANDLVGDEYLAVVQGGVTRRATPQDIERFLSGTYRKAQNATMVTLSLDQSISNATVEIISWSGTEFDDLGAWDSANPTRLTLPSGVDRGRLWAVGAWGVNHTGQRQLRLHKNGSFAFLLDQRNAIGNTQATGVANLPAGIALAAGDYVELAVYQDSGGALGFQQSGQFATQFGLEKLA